MDTASILTANSLLIQGRFFIIAYDSLLYCGEFYAPINQLTPASMNLKTILFILALLFIKQARYDEVPINSIIAKKINEENRNKIALIRTFATIGGIHYKQAARAGGNEATEKFSSSKSYIRKELITALEIDDMTGITGCFYDLLKITV